MIDVGSIAGRVFFLCACALICVSPAQAGNDKVAAFAKFALDRCVLPVLAGGQADSAGLLRQQQKTDSMNEEQLEIYHSRKVFTKLAQGVMMVVPDTGGCMVLALSVPVVDIQDAVNGWARQDVRLSQTSAETVSTDKAATEYVWTVGDRSFEMQLRTDAAKSRAALVMNGGG